MSVGERQRPMRRLLAGSVTLLAIGAGGPALAQSITGDEAPTLNVTAPPAEYVIDASKGVVTSDPQSLTIRNDSVASAITGSMLLPSSWVGAYTLTVTAKDEAGNQAQRQLTVNYEPVRAGLATAASGRVSIPATTQAVKGNDGRYPFTTQTLKRADGSVLQGTLPLRAALKSDSTVSLIVNGKKVDPGTVVDIGTYNFTSSSQLSLPVADAVEGAVGTANLMVLIGDPGAPVVEANVTTWAGTLALNAATWSYRQALDSVQIAVETAPSVPCRVVVGVTPNRAADVCRLTYTKLPEGLSTASGSNALTGRLWNLGDQEIAYTLYYYDGASEVAIASGTKTITATSAYGLLSFGNGAETPALLRSIDSVDLSIQQKTGPSCTLTTAVDAARMASSSGNIGCLLEWGTLPAGLTQDARAGTPRLKGVLKDAGLLNVPWTVSFISPGGTKTLVSQGDLLLESKDPDAPQIAFASALAKDGERISVPVSGGAIGEAVITAARSVLMFEVVRGGAIQAQEIVDLSRARDALASTRRKVTVGAAPIWDTQSVTLRAYYRDLPDIKSETVLDTLAVAASTVKPDITAGAAKTLDTDALPVFVAIKDTSAASKSYDANTMGRWRVRVVMLGSGNTVQPLTDYVDAADGHATFNVSLASLGGSSARLSAQAELIASNTSQQRVELAPRALNISVLRGGAIGSSIVAQRVRGAAPVSASFQLRFDDQRDQSAVGTIEWQVSRDDGATWTAAPGGAQNKTRYSDSFSAGTYLVRAKTTNKNSQVYSFSDSVEVSAYNVPALAIAGPTGTFVGGKATLTATATLKNDDSALVIEWSATGGKSWEAGGPSFDYTGMIEGRNTIKARARAASSPADLAESWVEATTAIEFFRVRAPSVRLNGPSTVETGRASLFRANMAMPYPRLQGTVNGEWVLPDGSRVEGTELSWTPSAADEAKGSVTLTFTGWVEGFRDAGAVADSTIKVNVWSYRWPTWQMTVRSSYDVAPSDGQITIGAAGSIANLENLTYEWAVPADVTFTDASRDLLRKFRVERFGDFPIAVTIRDARGNSSTVEGTVALKEAAPLVLALDIRPGNKYWRAPLEILVLPKLSGGHPADRPSTYAYRIDEQQVAGTGTMNRITSQEGQHAVSVSVGTKMGQTAETTEVVNVAPNKVPTCTLQTVESSSAWSYTASCTDPDGAVKSFRWFVDGDEQSLRSNRISVSKRNRSEAPVVAVIGVDDGGAESQAVQSR